MCIEKVVAYASELNSLLSQIKNNEYSMYSSLEKLDPVSQDSLPYLIESTKNSLLLMRKIAMVHNRTVTQMQMRRIETNANVDHLINNKIMQFRTQREAMHYLTESK
jgi:hypothetical protein